MFVWLYHLYLTEICLSLDGFLSFEVHNPCHGIKFHTFRLLTSVMKYCILMLEKKNDYNNFLLIISVALSEGLNSLDQL